MKIPAFFRVAPFALFASCSFVGKTPAPAVPAANWKSLSGLVRYEDSHRSIVADAILRVGPQPQTYSMEITKAGASLLKMDRAGSIGWSKGFLGGRSYYGSVNQAPANLQSWFQATETAISGKKTTPPTAQAVAPAIKIDFRLEP